MGSRLLSPQRMKKPTEGGPWAFENSAGGAIDPPDSGELRGDQPIVPQSMLKPA